MAKFFLRTGQHGIRKGVLSQSRGCVFKSFPGGFAPRPPHFSSPQLIHTACIKLPNEYEQPKRSVGPKNFSRSNIGGLFQRTEILALDTMKDLR